MGAMIAYRKYPDQWILTTQTDHASFSGELLSLWRRDDLPSHPRREELLFAVREHDNGWWEADSAPRVSALTSEPYDFLTMPDYLRREIWHRGIVRHRQEHPYASRLIAEHARRLHEHRRQEEDYASFLEKIEQISRELEEEVEGVSAQEIQSDYRFLELTDLLSLAVCNEWMETLDFHGYRFQCEGDTLRITPFPLAGTTTFAVRCRAIPDRPFTGDADLGAELAAARWRRREIRVMEGQFSAN